MKDKAELNLINRMIDDSITRVGSISQSNDVTLYYDELELLMEQYANQRVIENLKFMRGEYMYMFHIEDVCKFTDRVINKLKQ